LQNSIEPFVIISTLFLLQDHFRWNICMSRKYRSIHRIQRYRRKLETIEKASIERDLLWYSCTQNLDLFGVPISWHSTYLMKVIHLSS